MQRITYVLRKNAPVSRRNKHNITNEAMSDKIDPRFVPSNKSVGTLRYISNRPIHRKFPDIFRFTRSTMYDNTRNTQRFDQQPRTGVPNCYMTACMTRDCHSKQYESTGTKVFYDVLRTRFSTKNAS